MKPATLIAIAAAVFLMSEGANAQPIIVGAHVGSAHSAPGFCNVNPGVYARWENGATVGAYRNSECRASVYAGKTFDLVERGRFTLSATVGAVTGYSVRPITPLLVPSVAIQVGEGKAVRLAFVPKVEKGGAHALHLMFEVRQ